MIVVTCCSETGPAPKQCALPDATHTTPSAILRNTFRMLMIWLIAVPDISAWLSARADDI